MTVELTPEMESIVSDRLSSGRYSSAQAVLEDALRALPSREIATNAHLTPGVPAFVAPYLPQSEEKREERARRLEDLFARVDAEGGFDFEVERDRTPPRERELW